MEIQSPSSRQILINLADSRYEVEVPLDESLSSAKQKIRSRHQIPKSSKILFWVVNNKLTPSPTLPVPCFPNLQYDFCVTLVGRKEYHSGFKKVYIRQGQKQHKVVVSAACSLATVDELYKIISNKHTDPKKFLQQAKSIKITYFDEDAADPTPLDLNTKLDTFKSSQLVLQAYVNRVKFRLKLLPTQANLSPFVESKFYFIQQLLDRHAGEIAQKVFNSQAHRVVFVEEGVYKHFTQRLGQKGMSINPRKQIIDLAEIPVQDPVEIYMAHAQKEQLEFPRITVPLKQLLGCSTEQIMQMYQSYTGTREPYKSINCYPIQKNERVAECWPKDRMYGKFQKLGFRISCEENRSITPQTHESDIINNFLNQIKPITEEGEETLKKQRINALIRDYQTRLKALNKEH